MSVDLNNGPSFAPGWLLTLSAAAYAATFLLASSVALSGPRRAFGWLLDKLFGPDRFRMEECRMCVGFWVVLAMWLLLSRSVGDIIPFLAVYGLSYFLATQER